MARPACRADRGARDGRAVEAAGDLAARRDGHGQRSRAARYPRRASRRFLAQRLGLGANSAPASGTASRSSASATATPHSRTATPWSSPAPLPVDSRLYLITDARPGLSELVEAAIGGGVDIVQIRDREVPDGELLRVLQEVRALTRRLEVPLVVNDRPDLAVLVEADFVHVGQDDLPVEAARRFDLRVGQSTHAPAELDATAADYAGVGPVYETPTKAGRAAAGLEYVRYAAGHARSPWFAIGGIDETNVADVVAAGAERIAVVRAITDAPNPSAQPRRCAQPCGTDRYHGSAVWRSPVAQLAEHPAVNRRVVGSSPTRGATTILATRKPAWFHGSTMPGGSRLSRPCCTGAVPGNRIPPGSPAPTHTVADRRLRRARPQ